MKENQQDGFAIMTLHEPTVQSSSNFKKPLCKGGTTPHLKLSRLKFRFVFSLLPLEGLVKEISILLEILRPKSLKWKSAFSSLTVLEVYIFHKEQCSCTGKSLSKEFLQQLTHNMAKDCSMNYKFSSRHENYKLRTCCGLILFF